MKAFHNKYAIWFNKNFGYILIYTSSEQADSVENVNEYAFQAFMYAHAYIKLYIVTFSILNLDNHFSMIRKILIRLNFKNAKILNIT